MKKIWFIVIAVVILVSGGVAYFLLRPSVEEEGEEMVLYQEDWLPFVLVEEGEISPLDGFTLGGAGLDDTVGTKVPPGNGGAVTKGVPANYPEKVVPLYKVSDIDEDMSTEDEDGFSVMYSSEAPFSEIVEFYHEKLGDKPQYREEKTSENEMWIRCTALEYQVEIQIYGDESSAMVLINILYLSH